MSWNFRVARSMDRAQYFIAEVYYGDDNEIQGWCDRGGEILGWEDYGDLKDTVGHLQAAFDLPILQVIEGERLVPID